MTTDRDIIKDYNERYQQANSVLQEYRDEAKIDLDFYLGDQYTDKERAYLASNERQAVTNNKIRRSVDMLSGWQRANRKSSVMLAQTDDVQRAADQLSNALQWVYQKRNGYNHISDCFTFGSLITGINFSEIVLDYESDPARPDISFVRIPYNGAVWDPYFTKLDMSDCAYFIRRSWMSKPQAISLLPEHAKQIEDIECKDHDDKFTDMSYPMRSNSQDMLAYTEFWERVIEDRPFLIDKVNDQIISEVKTEDKEFTDSFLKQFPNMGIIKRRRSVVKLHVIINDEVISSGNDPLDIGEYPFVPFIGVYAPEHSDFVTKLQSWSRTARDPQRELNKRISKILDIMDKKVHSGMFYKPGKLIDKDDVYDTGNSSNIALRDDAILGQDIAERSPPQTDSSLFQMVNLFDNNIMDNLGLNDATFGSPEGGNDSALLVQMRQQSSMIGAEPYFDNLNQSQYLHARKVTMTIQRWWDDVKFQRVIGETPVPQVYDPSFTKFDANITQGVLTETQSKMYFLQQVELKKMGFNIKESDILRDAPIQRRSDFVERMEQDEKAAQEEQAKQNKILEEQMYLANQKTISEIKENQSDLVRSNSRAYADQALSQAHTAESVQKRANASLDMVRAAIEIQNNQEDRFEQSLQFVTALTDKYKQENDNEMMMNTAIVDRNIAEASNDRDLGDQDLEQQSQEPQIQQEGI